MTLGGTDAAVVADPAELGRRTDAARAGGARVGLVPTMGALHAGHLALIARAAAECDTVVVSIFVNPLQFGPQEDFAAYPRRLERDVDAAAAAGAGTVFAPDAAAMYPDGFTTSVHVGGVAEVLEGAARPGHFDGVATVVTKLFVATGRCRAYFGEKDFQQLAVVRRLVADLGLPVDVVGCPIVREPDGLALSSRNAYLDADQRRAAPVLHRALQAGAAVLANGATVPAAVVAAMTAELATETLVDTEYAVVVDPASLTTPAAVTGPVRLLVAGRLGRTRLIDNLGV